MSLRMTINVKPPAEGDSLGCRISDTNTVTGIDFLGAAKVAGLSVGDVITSVQGCTIKADAVNAAKLMLASSVGTARDNGLSIVMGIKRQASVANEMTLGGITTS